MKQFVVNITMLLFFVAMSSSCSALKFTIHAEPGTTIEDKDQRVVGVADNSGQVRLKVRNRDADNYRVLYTRNKQTNLRVPFVLDHKYQSNKGAVYGLILLPILPVGFPILMSSSFDDSYYDHYKFLPEQYTNQGIQFTSPVYERKSNTTTASKAISKNEKEPTTRSKRTIKNNTVNIDGTYTGSGELTLNSVSIEKYSKIQVIIKKISDDKVRVNVIEGGEAFFENDCTYTVTRSSGGGYDLVLEGNKNATIIISPDNKMTYIHPNIAIENTVYKLAVSAKKQ